MGSSKSKSDNIDNTNKTAEHKEHNTDNEVDKNSVIYISNTTSCFGKKPTRLLQYKTKDTTEIKQSLESKM
jgi:hypothetical protein